MNDSHDDMEYFNSVFLQVAYTMLASPGKVYFCE